MKAKPVILVVDDQPENIDLLESYLVPQGYEIVKSANGEEALKKLSAHPIDLILLDVMMPGMDGFEVTRRVKQDKNHRLLPIIMVTALQETEDRTKGIEAGCDDFISMPVDKMELLARVRSLLKVKAYNDLMSNYQKELESEVTRRTEELKHALENLQQDIIERKRAEEQLRLSEELFRLIAESATDLIAVLDLEGKRIYSSPSYKSILGDPESLRGTDSFQEIHPEDQEKIRRIFLETVRTGIGQRAEYRFLLDDGSVRHIESQGSVIRDANGNTNKVVVVSRDVTERKQAEQEINRLAKFPSENPYPVLRMSRDGIVLYANIASGALLGMWGCAVGSSAPQFWRDLAAQVLASRENKTVEVECNGKVYSMFVTPVAEQDYLNLYGRDITERKKAEEALELVNSQLRNLHNNLPEALFSVDLVHNKMLQVSPAHEAVFGHPADEFFKNPQLWYELIVPEDKPIVDAGYPALSAGKIIHHQYRMVDPKGKIRWIEAKVVPTLATDGTLIRVDGIASDITERKRVEEAIRESEEKFRLVFENAYDGISIFEESPDPNHRKLVDCNLRYAEMAGRTREELIKIGNTLELARTLSEDNTKSIQQAVAFRGSYSWIRPDGKDNIIEYAAAPIKIAGKTFTIGIDRDITERKLTEAAIQEKVAELQRWQDLMLDRQDRTQELKHEVNKLCLRAGETPRYPSGEDRPVNSEAGRPNL